MRILFDNIKSNQTDNEIMDHVINEQVDFRKENNDE